ncbi:MAG: hypothetical protein IPH44_09445 [Myxococcales bacterium]|nr:hypothetical protein [Myxococcales bacterium]MBK7198771.1 hypothetical protein [Myxococcales bacterium]MBP6847668.1 hypothetical protein [Kofleriaceae bacterium]
MSPRPWIVAAIALVAAVGGARATPNPPGPPPELTRPNANQGEVEAIAATLTAPAAADLEARLAPTVRVSKRVGCRGVAAVARGGQRRKLAACLRARVSAAGVAVLAVRGQRRVRARLELRGTPAEFDPSLVLELRPARGGLEIVGVDWVAPTVRAR